VKFYRCVVGEQPAGRPAALYRPDERRRRRPASDENLVDSGRRLREPQPAESLVGAPLLGADVRVAAEDHGLVRVVELLDDGCDSAELPIREGRRDVEVGDETHIGEPDDLADTALTFASRADHERAGVEDAVGRPDEDGGPLAGESRPEQAVVCGSDQATELRTQEPGPCRDGLDRRHPAPGAEPSECPDWHLLEAEHVWLVGGGEAHHLFEKRAPLRRHGIPVEEVPGAYEERHVRSLRLHMRVLLADPPAFTPTYDHELAAALARAGAEVELVTSRFRFGQVPAADGYVRAEVFYPLSSRVFRRSPLRLPLKALEHPVGLAALRRRRADVLHLQWLAAPELDARLFRPQAPAVFTAHDLLPRRTAKRPDLWRRLLERFERVVVHSENGRGALEGMGVDPGRLRVVPHPVFPSDPPRRDDGRTVLAFGVIRPYKGLADAIDAVRAAGDARLLVAGDPLEPLEPYRASAAGLDVEWRLGYLVPAEVDRAFGDATIAVFPYKPELDQSGALLRALGAGVPAVAYDVGGVAEPVRRFGAGRVVAAGDVAALAAAIAELLGDPAALEDARAGARRAREELTWDASARAHLMIYEEIV
jgi:glycosyltransferase involved in cell wall biosynthesis